MFGLSSEGVDPAKRISALLQGSILCEGSISFLTGIDDNGLSPEDRQLGVSEFLATPAQNSLVLPEQPASNTFFPEMEYTQVESGNTSTGDFLSSFGSSGVDPLDSDHSPASYLFHQSRTHNGEVTPSTPPSLSPHHSHDTHGVCSPPPPGDDSPHRLSLPLLLDSSSGSDGTHTDESGKGFSKGQASTHYISRLKSSSSLDLSGTLPQPFVKETDQVRVIKDTVTRQKKINDYVIVKPLGKGSYGTVMLVRHATANEDYAMKIIRPKKKQPCKTKEAHLYHIQREVAVMKRLSHPHLVSLIEVIGSVESGILCLVQPYFQGGCIAVPPPSSTTPGSVIPIAENTLRRHAFDLLHALKYLQRKGIAHRDIKPENILLDREGKVYLADFGVSAICGDEDSAWGVEGTPAYMAPELYRGESEVVSHLVDMWALGVSLYQLLYGVLPFYSPSPLALSAAIQFQPLTFPDEEEEEEADYHGPRSSPAFKTMLRGMLEKDPQQRWGIRCALSCDWIVGEESEGAPVRDSTSLPGTPILPGVLPPPMEEISSLSEDSAAVVQDVLSFPHPVEESTKEVPVENPFSPCPEASLTATDNIYDSVTSVELHSAIFPFQAVESTTKDTEDE